MAISQRLDIRQSQTLVMTPQLQQSVKLLQLSNLELNSFLATELERNPLLEQADEAGLVVDDESPGSASEGEPVASDQALRDAEDMPDGAALADIDLSAEDYWRGESEAGGQIGSTAGAAGSRHLGMDDSGIEQTPAPRGGLREHLRSQLGETFADPADRLIGSHLIEMIDDAGYLIGSLDQIAADLNCPVSRIETTLGELQQFDPIGVGARSLGECLALQLADRGRLTTLAVKVLENLGAVAARDLATLRDVCGADDETILALIAELKSLNPKPGLAFDTELPPTIVPDVMVRPAPAGGWTVELNTDTLPRVMVNARYHAELRSKARGGEEKAFISECFQNASWLVRSLDQRARTILKVASELVRLQEDFLNHGIKHLRPLTLRHVAEAIEMHESTVSRVSTNKFMATPRGLFELKFFFSTGLANTKGGDDHAAEAVRHQIKELIDGEEPRKTLSDDRIADILSASGVRIARRTVAKYREAMRIPSSVERRRQKLSPAAHQ